MPVCKGENTVTTTLKVCCDTRKEECYYAKKVVSDNLNITLCTRKGKEKIT